MATPVVGELGGLFPRVNPPIVICTDVTNNPIEEELRLTVLFPESRKRVILHTIHFTVNFGDLR